MLTYLYVLSYDDEGDAASAEHYMVNGTKMYELEAATTSSTPLSAEELSRHAKLMNNVVVCAIAQKYDISELKEFATSRFRELLRLKAPSPSLLHVVNAVFETTSIAEPGLCNVVAKYCAQYCSKIIADDHLSTMIKDHGDLGLDILRQHKAEIGELEKMKTYLAMLKELKEKLALMMINASNITAMRAYENSLSVLRQSLKMAHDSISDKN